MNNKTAISPLWPWSDFRNWEQEHKYCNKSCSHCSYPSGNVKSFGELRARKLGQRPNVYEQHQIYMRNKYLYEKDQIYMRNMSCNSQYYTDYEHKQTNESARQGKRSYWLEFTCSLGQPLHLSGLSCIIIKTIIWCYWVLTCTCGWPAYYIQSS